MNPEAGFIQGPFRAALERITKDNPKMPANEAIRRARELFPAPHRSLDPVAPAPTTQSVDSIATPMEFEFGGEHQG